jgi:hypothetical protein
MPEAWRSLAGITISITREKYSGMENHLLERVDSLVEKYKKEHKGEPPLYIIVSADENKELMKIIKEANNFAKDQIVTTYNGIKIAEHPQQTDGKIYVSDELPETGS